MVVERPPGSLVMMEVVLPPGRMVRGLPTLMMVAVPPMVVEIVHQHGLLVRKPQLMGRLMPLVLAQKLQVMLATTPGAQKLPPTSHNHNLIIMVVGDNNLPKVTIGDRVHMMLQRLAQPCLPQLLLR